MTIPMFEEERGDTAAADRAERRIALREQIAALDDRMRAATDPGERADYLAGIVARRQRLMEIDGTDQPRELGVSPATAARLDALRAESANDIDRLRAIERAVAHREMNPDAAAAESAQINQRRLARAAEAQQLAGTFAPAAA